MLLSEADYKRSQYRFFLWGVTFESNRKLHILFIDIPILRNIFFFWKIKEFKKHITNNSRIGISIIFNYKII